MPVLVIAAVAALSLLAFAPAPSYDPWTWLLWGREVAGGGLSTAEGPAFKPLPVAVCALLAPLGGAAPWAWVLLVRAGAVAACWLAWRVGGALAALGVALTGGFVGQAAVGGEAPLVVAFALGGVELRRGGRVRAALLCGLACALLRVEAWPFLCVGCVVAWRLHPRARGVVALTLVAVPVAWFVPEWIGSGDPLRSGARALEPAVGAGSEGALAALAGAAGLVLWPLWAGLLARRAWPLAAAGTAWIAVVAVMAEAGFSGEPRYMIPGAAALSIAGAAGWVTLARSPAVLAGAAALVVLAAAPRLADLPALHDAQAHQQALASDLRRAIEAAGGRASVLACGTPYVGPLRGPLAAYHLEVTKRTVEPDAPPRPPGMVFRARLTPASAPAPRTGAPFRRVAAAGEWDVLTACS